MINLKRSAEVRCIDVTATVAVEQERPEFLAIVELAKHLGGELTPHQVQQELFRPFPEQTCRLALDRCVGLRMLEWVGGVARLSALGDLAVETRKILTPEQGVWRFYLIDDPLVPQPVVHMERIKTEPAHKTLSKQKNGEEGFREHIPTPALLRNSINTAAHRSLADSKLRQIQDVGVKGVERTTGRLDLDLSYSEHGPAVVRLMGRLPESEVRLDAATGSDLRGWTYAELWMELASIATATPVEELSVIKERLGVRAVPVPFGAVNAEGRKTFQTNIPVPKARLRDIGDFLPSSLSQVDILPATERDAQDWCEWLQWNEITDYVTPDMLCARADGVLARFPQHRPHPLEPDAIRLHALNSDDRFSARYVLAPSDLGLWN